MVADRLSVSERRKAFYTRVYRQAYSPQGDWLVASDSRSRLCFFSVREALSPQSASSSRRAWCHCMQLSAPVWALRQLGDILYCGDARGMLFAYSWSQLTANSARLNDSKPVFEVSAFGVEPGKMNPHEVNSIETLGENKLIYGGAFDNAVRLADSERPDKVISTFNGHEGNVNELVTRSEHEFVSASEDGTVRVWDTRTAQASRLIRICDEPQLRRNGCGIGVCALDICGSLMVCGGDIDLGLWLFESGTLITRMQCDREPTMRHLVAKMDSGRILCGGTSSQLFEYSYSGEHVTSVKTSASAVYSIEQNKFPGRQMTTVAGNSHLIDAFLCLGYVSFSLSTSLCAQE